MKLPLIMSCLLPLLLVSGGTPAAQESPDSEPAPSAPPTWTIPFELNGNHIVLPVKIGDKELRITLDNGNVNAETILYGGPRLEGLDLTFTSKISVGGAGKGKMPTAEVAEGVTLSLPGLELRDKRVIVMPHDPALSRAFAGEDGVFGEPIFKHYVVRIDHDKKVVVLTEPDRFEYEDAGAMLPIERFGIGSSALDCAITMPGGKEFESRLEIDLGSFCSISLSTGADPSVVIPEGAEKRTAWGAQGAFEFCIGRAETVRLGPFTLKNVPAVISESGTGFGSEGLGFIGGRLFRNFIATFDYTRNRLYLEPAGRFEGRLELDLKGTGPK
jgi:hypothetical protein